jgi:hypothetical protein
MRESVYILILMIINANMFYSEQSIHQHKRSMSKSEAYWV